MNKKADIPVTILVLGVFVVCSLALASFFLSNIKISKSFDTINLVQEMNSKVSEYDFYKSQGVSDTIIKEDILKLDDNFYILDNGFEINETEIKLEPGWSFDWIKHKLYFSIKYYL